MTDEPTRQILSIAQQLFELRAYAEQHKLTIVREFEESRTAKQPGRPVFNEMMQGIERGKAQGILAWNPDRLARNSKDGGEIIYFVDVEKIKDLQFPTFRFDTSANGKFMLSIAFGQSKYYVDNLSENIRRGMRHKIRNGLWPASAPLGYVNDKTTRGIAPDPARAPFIRKAFQLYATGDYTLAEVRDRVNALGMRGRNGNTLGVSEYHRILQNPVFYGMMRIKGELHDGKHEPVISKKLFDEAQTVRAKKSKAKTPQLKPYLFRGLFRCGECGCFITTETQKGHNYLRCTKRTVPCSQKCVREENMLSQIDGIIAQFIVEAQTADRVIAALETEARE